MDTGKSAANAELGAILMHARQRRGWSRARLAELSGIPETQVERIERNKRDINVTQLFKLAQALDVLPQELVRRSIDVAGGFDVIMAEVDGVSEAAATNVTKLRPRKSVEEMSVDEIEAQKNAATVDPEMDTDEPQDT